MFVLAFGAGCSFVFSGVLDISYFRGCFRFDLVFFYLTFLVLVLIVILCFLERDSFSRFFLVVRGLARVVSFCSVNCLVFWVFYEVSILCLLLLLVANSPYSERFIAVWYLLGYVCLTSLPMLLIFLFFSYTGGGFGLLNWVGGLYSWDRCGLFILLGVLFVTKIPLFPFHTWLPVVHAEASSSVSVCLSGYIMKLGVLGVVRFISYYTPSHVFRLGYVVIIMFCSLFFFLSSCAELDGKRWLAFMRLSHIVVPAACLCLGGFGLFSVSFLFCLVHGVSAGLVFILL